MNSSFLGNGLDSKMKCQFFGHLPLEYVGKLLIQNLFSWKIVDQAHTL